MVRGIAPKIKTTASIFLTSATKDKAGATEYMVPEADAKVAQSRVAGLSEKNRRALSRFFLPVSIMKDLYPNSCVW